MPDRRFLDLLRVHEALAESFLLHQEALMELRPLEALGRLEEVRRGIAAHIRDEEGELLPIYAARAGKVEGGGPELFLAEHRKIQALLDEFVLAVKLMIERPPGRRDVLGLLDRQILYKQLMEHHDLREKRFLYPILDGVTSAGEREAVFARLEQAG